MAQSQRLGFILILLTVTGYSFFAIWARQLTAAGMQPLDIATWRFLIAVPLLWLLVRLRRAPESARPLPRLALLAGGPLLTIAALAGFTGLTLIPASVYILLYYSYPAIVALIAVVRGERLSMISWLALGLTLAGVALTMPDLREGLQQSGNVGGFVLAMINALAVALYFVFSNRVLRDHTDMPRASLWSLTGALIPLLVIGLLRPAPAPPTSGAWLSMFALVIISTIIPVVTLNAGIQKLGAVRASIMSTLEPILTLILAVIVLGDRLTLIQLIGGALILASVIMVQLNRPDVTVNVLPEIQG
jgi:drug/metabolite transporter (DMT)-like permease